mgnify:CR=1 FL=1
MRCFALLLVVTVGGELCDRIIEHQSCKEIVQNSSIFEADSCMLTENASYAYEVCLECCYANNDDTNDEMDYDELEQRVGPYVERFFDARMEIVHDKIDILIDQERCTLASYSLLVVVILQGLTLAITIKLNNQSQKLRAKSVC